VLVTIAVLVLHMSVAVYTGGTSTHDAVMSYDVPTCTIRLAPWVDQGLAQRLVRPHNPRLPYAVYVFGHELGHCAQMRDGRPYSEDDANHFAATHFKIICRALEIGQRPTNRLWLSLPLSWRRA
jgi:hypothetical protein